MRIETAAVKADRRAALSALVILLLMAHTDASRADILHLSNGGVVRGEIDNEETTDELVAMTLLSGARITLPASLVVQREERPVKIEEYEVRAENLPDTIEAHWELAEWCRENHLDEQREIHLEAILEIDPEHRRAHYGLRHTFHNDRWMTREEYEQLRRDEGFVLYDGKWVEAEDLERVKANEARSKAEQKWFAKVRVWFNWATGRHPQRAADGLNNLRGIRNPAALPALIQFLGKNERPDVRRLFIETAAKIDGPAPVAPLATLAVREDVRELRELALQSIPEEFHEQAQAVVLDGLRDENNIIVQRSGAVLAKIGDDHAVPALIRALVTSHTYKVRVPVQGYSFGTDGSFASGPRLPREIELGLRTGVYDNVQVVPLLGAGARATKVVPVSVNRENSQVLTALRTITQRNFGFDENAWKRWWNVDRHQAELAPDLP